MNCDFEDKGAREKALAGVKRVVIKLGTRLLMDIKGQEMPERVARLVEQIA